MRTRSSPSVCLTVACGATLFQEAPTVTITAPGVVRGRPGDMVSVIYAIDGAHESYIEWLGPWDSRHRIDARDTIDVRVGPEAERFRLIAVGHDGRQHGLTVTVEPEPSERWSHSDKLLVPT